MSSLFIGLSVKKIQQCQIHAKKGHFWEVSHHLTSVMQVTKNSSSGCDYLISLKIDMDPATIAFEHHKKVQVISSHHIHANLRNAPGAWCRDVRNANFKKNSSSGCDYQNSFKIGMDLASIVFDHHKKFTLLFRTVFTQSCDVRRGVGGLKSLMCP